MRCNSNDQFSIYTSDSLRDDREFYATARTFEEAYYTAKARALNGWVATICKTMKDDDCYDQEMPIVTYASRVDYGAPEPSVREMWGDGESTADGERWLSVRERAYLSGLLFPEPGAYEEA